jgi:hypothetical protein
MQDDSFAIEILASWRLFGPQIVWTNMFDHLLFDETKNCKVICFWLIAQGTGRVTRVGMQRNETKNSSVSFNLLNTQSKTITPTP